MGTNGRRFTLFECAKLFEVQENTPGTGGDTPSLSLDSQSSIGIELSEWRECAGHDVLVLVCNNGYILFRVLPSHGKPTIKQLKWYETRQQHILCVAIDPGGEWLACACLDGGLYLIPIISLTLECAPVHRFGVLDDVTAILPSKKIASPTSIVWWDTMDQKHFCITGSEVGEITFFDLKAKEVKMIVYVSGCVDAVHLAFLNDRTTYLLMGMRGGEWKRMLLEEHYHEAPDVSYADVTAKDFEVVPDDFVIKSCLQQDDLAYPFDIKEFTEFSQINHLRTQDWRRQHLLSSLNLATHMLEAYSYSFDLCPDPLNSYQLLPGATDAILTDRLIFVVSHIDTVDPCSFTISLLSAQKSLITELSDQGEVIIQQFTIPSSSDLVGFYSAESHSAGVSSKDSHPYTLLGGCLIVTKTAVYHCRQVSSPDSLFLSMAVSPKEQEKAEDFGITLKLDICGLYKVAAERVLEERHLGQALKLFKLSRSSPQCIIESFAKMKKVPELLQYLHQAVYDDTGQASLKNTKTTQDLLFQCFLHECLRLFGTPDGSMILDKFSQFITDKFLYDQSIAIEGLLDCGLKEQLFELAKAHSKLKEVLETMVKQGFVDLSPSVQSSLASRRYISTVVEANEGQYIYQMMHSTFVRFIITKPAIIPKYLNYLLAMLPKLSATILVRLANLFDPSHTTIRPLLIQSRSIRPRSHSTGSLVSVSDSVSGGGGSSDEATIPKLEEYIEVFLIILILLNVRRKEKPAKSGNNVLTGKSKRGDNQLFAEASQLRHRRIVSGGLHHAALLVHGDLYTWGATKNGKLGHGDIEEEHTSIPLRVETFLMLNVRVLSVTCGAEHTIALCQEGVYSWGLSSHGQLGHGDTLKRSRPVQISALADKGIIAVECGQYHSLALSDDHSVWSWGWGVHGQLGLQSVEEKLLPTRASLLDEWNVTVISAGYGHSAVLTVNGKVLTFGNGMYGQLGHGNTEKHSAPKPVGNLDEHNVYLLACGNFHTVAVTMDQQVFIWGKNLLRTRSTTTSIHGLREYKITRQAHSSSPAATTNLHIPQMLDCLQFDDDIVQVSCGSLHSLFLTAKGTVYSWGSNVHGQLGHPQVPEMLSPAKVDCFDEQKIVGISAGDEFSVAIDAKSHPWSWGRGEHGQLGFLEPRSLRGGGESLKLNVFIPSLIDSLSELSDQSGQHGGDSPTPLLDIDLEWNLTDFATVGSPHISYGRKALDTALTELHGFYRTSAIVWWSQDWNDWESMATIYNEEKQWPQALKCCLRALTQDVPSQSIDRDIIIGLFHTYEGKLRSDTSNYQSAEFVNRMVQILEAFVDHWEKQSLSLSELEVVLEKKLSTISFPLSLVIRDNVKFSFEFHMEVAKCVVDQIMNGVSKPEDVLNLQPEVKVQTDNISSEESLSSEAHLWTLIIRNLAKDVFKISALPLIASTLISSFPALSSVSEKNKDIHAFSCGHAFPGGDFESRVLIEFKERMQDFPTPIPQTVLQLYSCYKKLRSYPLSCPYCVFQHLRQLQLQESPDTPIKPWNL